MPGPRSRTFEERLAFVRERTRPAPVPLVPELTLFQAQDVTPLWHATQAELDHWDPAPFWAFPWAGGQALARYLLDRPELVRGRAVFDFATGSGLVAIAAARAGAGSVVACDLDPFAEAAVRLNVELNGVALSFRAGDPMGDPLAGIDVVLAGDVFYEAPLARDSMAWLAALAGRGALVLAGDPNRLHAPQEGFVERAVYEVPTSPALEAATSLFARVLEILPSTVAPTGA